MNIRISQTHGQIGINTTPSQLNLKSRSPNVQISQEYADVKISQDLPKVKIDQYDCFKNLGFKNYKDLMKDIVSYSKGKVLEYISKKANDGDRFADFYKGGKPLIDMIKRDSQKEHNLPYKYSYATPRISVTGNVDIDFDKNVKPVTIHYQKGEININYTPSKVDIYMMQKPSISIDYIGGNIDAKT